MDNQFRARLVRAFKRVEESRASAAQAYVIPSRSLTELLAFPASSLVRSTGDSDDPDREIPAATRHRRRTAAGHRTPAGAQAQRLAATGAATVYQERGLGGYQRWPAAMDAAIHRPRAGCT